MQPPHRAPGAPTDRSELDPRRKRALFRAWHRGTREMDLVMGRFADREIAGLDEAELDAFERLMDEPDPSVYAWVTGQAEPPGDHDAALIARLGTYRG